MVERPRPRARPAPMYERTSATASIVRRLRSMLRRWLHDMAADPDTVDGLVCGVSEAAENAVEHAFAEAASGTVTLTASVVSATERCAGAAPHVVITLSDDGRWRPAGEPGYRGRGLRLIRGAAPIVQIETSAEGTTVTLRTPVVPRPGPTQ